MNSARHDVGSAELGVGLISVGWMGRLHTNAYQAIPIVYPDLDVRTRLVHAADTAEDRAFRREVRDFFATNLPEKIRRAMLTGLPLDRELSDHETDTRASLASDYSRGLARAHGATPSIATTAGSVAPVGRLSETARTVIC